MPWGGVRFTLVHTMGGAEVIHAVDKVVKSNRKAIRVYFNILKSGLQVTSLKNNFLMYLSVHTAQM